MPTIVFRSIIEYSEALARRVLGEFPSSWAITNSDIKYVSVPYGTTFNLDAYTTYMIAADPASPLIVGWIFNSNTVEMPVNGFTVIKPPATPYLRNPAVLGTNPIPAKVFAFA